MFDFLKKNAVTPAIAEEFYRSNLPQNPRLSPSLCISYSTKSGIHGIIINPYNTKTDLKYTEMSARHSGKKVIQSSYNT